MSLTAFPPLPTEARRDFAFKVPDPEGAPSSNGSRYHSAVDWFSPAGTTVYAPRGGTVIEARNTGDISGQVFGGTVKIRDESGRVWAMRHVVPTVGIGRTVDAGDPVAMVSAWLDWPGGTHCHMEIWKTLAGGYRHENMLDPADIVWDAKFDQPAFYFEELPHDRGGTGPKIVGQAAGYAKPTFAKWHLLRMKAAGMIVSSVRAEDDRTYLLSWAPGTYGKPYRFGPRSTALLRDDLAINREHSTNRKVRRFNGRARSIYPWPRAT